MLEWITLAKEHHLQMVAFQKVEYDSTGKILPPRPELMRLHRELNGPFTSTKSHWHRHTIATEGSKSFDRAMAKLKAELISSGAEVIAVEQQGLTVVDVFYLMENPNRTAEVLRGVARGSCPPVCSLSDLSPAA